MKDVMYENNIMFSIRNIFTVKIKPHIKMNISLNKKYCLFWKRNQYNSYLLNITFHNTLPLGPITLRANVKFRNKNILQFIKINCISNLNTSYKHQQFSKLFPMHVLDKCFKVSVLKWILFYFLQVYELICSTRDWQISGKIWMNSDSGDLLPYLPRTF